MSLDRVSDDVLLLLLSLINGDDVLHLIMSGSHSLASRVSQKMTNFVFESPRNSLSPSSLWSLPNLESVTIKSSLKSVPMHFSNQKHPILPLEPYKGLASLVLDAMLSGALLSPHPTSSSLSYILPNLKHLHLSGYHEAIPDNFTEGLPTQLESLVLHPALKCALSPLSSSIFESMPKTLSKIELLQVEIREGRSQIDQLSSLTHLKLFYCLSRDILDSLPPHLEVCELNMNKVEGSPFRASQMPSQIRDFKLYTSGIRLVLDAPLPATLEVLTVPIIWEEEMPKEELPKFICPLALTTASPLDHIPYSTQIHGQYTSLTRLSAVWMPDTREIEEKTFSESIRHLTFQCSYSYSHLYNHLPQGLVSLKIPLNNPEQTRTLPKTLTQLHIHFTPFVPTTAPAINDTTTLPSSLTYLKADSMHFASVNNIHTLPKLRFFDLTVSTSGFLSKLNFRGNMLKSLEHLNISEYITEEADSRGTATDFFPPLLRFSNLRSLAFRSTNTTPLHRNSLASLPQSLTSLQLDSVEFEDADKCLAKLPPALASLHLSEPSRPSVPFEDKLFYALPPNLVSLEVFASNNTTLTQNVLSFLPRRISSLVLPFSKGYMPTDSYYASNDFWQ